MPSSGRGYRSCSRSVFANPPLQYASYLRYTVQLLLPDREYYVFSGYAVVQDKEHQSRSGFYLLESEGAPA